MNENVPLPPEFAKVLVAVQAEPEHVRATWRYALVLLMIDEERARITEMRQDGETLHLVLQTWDGVRFAAVRPPISEETEQLLLEQIREIRSDAGVGE